MPANHANGFRNDAHLFPSRRGAPSRDRPHAASAAAEGPPPVLPVLRSEDLFVGTREVTILHHGEAYRLRLTSNEKLILTK